jgi:CheY-like chemotaxis protein
MPELDGYEATGEIRTQERRRAERLGTPVPSIALTANTMAADRDRCLLAGMDDYLPKPVRPDGLSLTLARWARPVELEPSPLRSIPVDLSDAVGGQRAGHGELTPSAR